jgi:photosystem II stability/assembly factor-like uncharacterized protein
MKKVVFIFLVIFYCSYVNLFSQSYSKVTWHKLSYYNPYGGIYQIEISSDYPNIIYVATNGFHKVIENEGIVDVLYSGWISCFAIDPNNGNNIYMSPGSQLLFSGDAGKNWTTKNSYGDIQSIAVYKNNINIIYLGVHEQNVGYSILKSTNGGDTFTKIDYSFSSFYSPECLLVSSGNPDIAFIGTDSNGIYKINGESVTHVLNYLNIDSIKEDPSDSNIIYAGTNDGIYKSVNCGNTWTRISFFNKSIQTLKIDPENTNIIYTYVLDSSNSGIYRCTDGGYNWTYLGGKISNDQISSIAINPLNSNQIFIAGAAWIGLWKTNILETNNSLTITSPHSSTTWEKYQTYKIQWNDVGSIERIDLFVLKGNNVVDTKTNLINDGEYEYTPYFAAGNDYRIKMKDYTNKEIVAYSDYFSIVDPGGSPQITVTSPNGGEIWEVGSTHNITWNSTGYIDDVAIQYSTNNGSSWTTIQYNTNNDGIYAWTVHNTPSNQCRVRISDTTGVPSDISDSTFSIVPGGSVITLNDALDNSILNFSTGGYEDWFGQSSIYYYGGSSAQSGDIFNDEDTYLQTTISGPGNLTFYWKVSSEYGYDYLSLYIDGELKNKISGDIDWCQESHYLSSGSHMVKWVYEKDESVHLGSDCGWIDKVYFTGSVTPTITIIKPNGTQTWPVGSTKEIKWTTTGSVGNLRVEYSINGGASWILIDNSTTNDGILSWIIPNTPSLNCLVKLSSVDDPSISDTSDLPFVIYDPGVPASITVISPNGGESWGVGTTQMITWTTSGLSDHVKIEYSTNNGINWAPVENHTQNDGIRPWVIPDEPSSHCKIKVSSYIDSKIFDVSDSTFTIKSEGVPELLIDKKELYFGGSTTGLVTPSQKIFINKQGGGTVAWEAYGNESWLSCSPTSGTDSGELTISVNTTGLSAGNYTDVVVLEAPFTANSEQNIAIYLTVYQHGQTSAPIGTFETPIHDSTVMSSIPVTGWALDDIGVESVKIYRGNTGSLVYIGDAVFVEGARPDIEQAYPDYPMNYKAGWGYMMLTNFLPNGGNGTFKIHAIATDVEGKTTSLGTKTITVDNANAVKPFGAIDTPRQGGIASGSSFRNHGWVLTPMPNSIPTNGSTINVYVDGMNLGHPTYNIYRSDVAALFPGYANKDGAGGYYDIDTTAYTNGVHTIYWIATDSGGNSDGIGSRYFSIQNTGSSRSGSKIAGNTQWKPIINIEELSNLPFNYVEPIKIKKGYGRNIQSKIIQSDEKNIFRIEIRELERIELHISNVEAGYMLAGNRIYPLPIGSTIDTRNDIFSWIPGPGFYGNYRFVFLVKDQNGDLSKREILIQIVPKFGLNK